MSRTIRRARWTRRARLAALPVAVLAAAGIISTSSYAAFSSTTSNDGNSWESGSVRLTDDDAGSALFTVTDVQPGDEGENCVTVTSEGSLPATVRLYGKDHQTTNLMSSHLQLVVEQGTGGRAGDCQGFVPDPAGAAVFSGTLAGFASTHRDHATGAATWSPEGQTAVGTPESRTFRIHWTLADDAPNSVQSSFARIAFVWEGQSRQRTAG